MEKNKIITSLTLAGILTAGVLGGNSNAVSNSQGVCKNIISGESLVPYILENRDDFVTSARLKAEYTTASNLQLKYSDRVSTGDTFTTSTGKKTVLVYGDVNQDGRVTTMDASIAQNIVLGANATEIQKAAADVRRNNSAIEVTTMDASAIQQFVLNGGDYVNVKPVGVKDEVVDSNYSIRLNNNNYINNKNADASKLIVRTEQEFDEAKTLTYQIMDTEKGSQITTGTITIPAHTLQDDSTEIDFTSTSPKVVDETTPANNVKSVTVVLKDGDKVVGTATFENKYAEPTAAKVTAIRVDAKIGAISFVGLPNEKITAVKYTVGTYSDSTAKPITVTGNELKAENGKLDCVFPDGDATYDIEYVLVDEYGNETTDPETLTLPKDGIPAAEAVESVVAPDITKVDTAVFTVTPNNVSGKAYLYKGNTLIAEKEFAAGATDDFATEIAKNGAGSYKVGVVVSGDNENTIDSAEKQSNTITVKELNPVTKIAFNTTSSATNLGEITWNDSNDKNKLANDPYTVSFEELDTTTGLYKTKSMTKDIDYEFNGAKVLIKAGKLDPNKVYRVKVEANAKAGQLEYINSTSPAVSTGFFFIDATSLLNSITPYNETEDSIILNIGTPVVVNKLEATYKVELYEVKIGVNGEKYAEPEPTKVVDTAIVVDPETKDKTMTVSGLHEDRQYIVRVLATVGDVTGKTDFITYTDGIIDDDNTPMTYKNPIDIKNLTVVKGTDVEKALPGTIFVNTSDNTVIVNGDKNNVIKPTESDRTKNNYTPEFKNILKLVQKLQNGDKITVNGKESIKLQLANISNKTTAITLGTESNGLEILVEGDGSGAHDRVMDISSATPKKVTIGGNGLVLDLTAAADQKVILNNGAEVVGNNNYVISSGATVTINGIKVNTTSANIDVTATGTKALTVATPKGDLNTNLTFTNVNDERYPAKDEDGDDIPAAISFTGVDNTSRVIGTVTINSTKGAVEVNAVNDGLNVTNVNLNINVTDANVDISGFTDTQSTKVNVNVTADKNNPTETASTITATAEKDVPTKLDGKTIEIKDYTGAEEIKDITGNKITDDAEEIAEIAEFINSFGINGKGATITCTKLGKTVVITFTKAENVSGTITGLEVYNNK